MPSARGYAPFHVSAAQDALLDRIIASGRDTGGLGIFDLDGCLFDTRARQVGVLRAIGSRRGWPDLYRVGSAHFAGWDLRETLRRAGVPTEWVRRHFDELRRDWLEGFFEDEAVCLDHAMPGAARLVGACAAAGIEPVYLSGRHAGNLPASERALGRWGFPPGRLVFQERQQGDYTAWKNRALDEIITFGRPSLFLDNEPSNVNLFHERFPDALVVFVETDHSPRPDRPAPAIPWLRGFLRTSEWSTS